MTAVSDQLIGAAIAQSRELLILLDPESLRFIYSNSAAESSLGYESGEICEISPHDLFPEFSVPELTTLIENLSASETKHLSMNTVLVSKLSGMRDYMLQLQYVEIDQKKLILITGHDITERMAETDQMQEMLASVQMNSMLDPQTGLMQRVFFLPYLMGGMEQSEETGQTMGVMLLDISNLAEINTAYGEETGNKVLRHIGQIVMRLVDTQEYASRFSGQKVCLLLPAASKQSVQELVKQLMRAVGRLSYAGYPDLEIKPRMGIWFGKQQYDPEILLGALATSYKERKDNSSDLLMLLAPDISQPA